MCDASANRAQMLLRDYGALWVDPPGGEEGHGSAVHVVAVVDYLPEELRAVQGKRSSNHPFLGHLPAKLQRHFNPRKMELDRHEMPYSHSRDTWFNDTTQQAHPMAASVSTVATGLGNVRGYVVPVALQPFHSGNDGMMRLGRQLHTELSSFILATQEQHVVLSFIGIGIAGLMVRASLAHFARDTSVLALSDVAVQFGSLVTLGTPHLGVRRSPEVGNAWTWVREFYLVHRYGLVGRELLLEDADFALMDISLHDTDAAKLFASFKRRVFVAVRHDTFASEVTSLLLADSRMTPLGKYVRMCDRVSEDLPVEAHLIPLPVPSQDPTRRAELLYSTAAYMQYCSLETVLGPPLLGLMAHALYATAVGWSGPVVLGLDMVMVGHTALFVFSFLLFLASGFAYASGFRETPIEERFQHLHHPLSRDSFFKTTCRVFNTALTDPASEVSVNVVKEVLNYPEDCTIERLAVSPCDYTSSVMRRAHSAVHSPQLLHRATALLHLAEMEAACDCS